MADFKAFSPSSWKAFTSFFKNKAVLSVTELPTASEAYTNMVRFNLEDNKWYVCVADEEDTYTWVDLTPAIPPAPDVSKFSKQFNGTLAEWNALSAEEQNEYDSAALDDMAGAGAMLTGTVEEGNENAVTSDAVAKVMNDDVTITAGVIAVSASTYAKKNGGMVMCAGTFNIASGTTLAKWQNLFTLSVPPITATQVAIYDDVEHKSYLCSITRTGGLQLHSDVTVSATTNFYFDFVYAVEV